MGLFYIIAALFLRGVNNLNFIISHWIKLNPFKSEAWFYTQEQNVTKVSSCLQHYPQIYGSTHQHNTANNV